MRRLYAPQNEVLWESEKEMGRTGAFRLRFLCKESRRKRRKMDAGFQKEQPLYLEIGCGKGGFAGQLALKNPDKNIIALDIKVDMLGVGRRTIVKLLRMQAKRRMILQTFYL